MKGYVEPKGREFQLMFTYDKIKLPDGKEHLIKHAGSITYGLSSQNAVFGHQINSNKFPTSGISTTPIWERAMYYALKGLKKGNGVILEMNLNNLDKSEFEWHEINKLIANPTCREDNEILIRRFDNDVFPLSLFKIHEIII